MPDADDAGTGEVGTSDDAGTHQALCDGMPHLRLAAAFVGGGPVARGSMVRTENGYALFAVDGHCTYWIAAGWVEVTSIKDRPVRTGTLSDADARLLEENLALGDVPSLAGNCSPNSIPDADVRSIRGATGEAICGQGPAGARFEAAWAAVKTVATKLASEGVPVDGPLHVAAVRARVVGAAVIYAWPTSLPLDAFILDAGDENKVGVSRLVDDPGAASQLRAVRDQYLVDEPAQPGLHPGDGLLATDESTTVEVFMRDAIPYEDAQGFLRF